MIVRFGIVGCGAIAQRHAALIAAHPEARLVAAYDVIHERARTLCSRHDATAAESLEQLLASEIEAVCICTPNGIHREGAVAALKAGKHVLVEKPMALSVADCEEMISVSLRTGRRLFVVKQNRYNPPVRAVKELLDANGLGRILAVQVNCFWNRRPDYYRSGTWRGTRLLDGGTLFTQFSHFVDILYYLFGDLEDVIGRVDNVAHQGLIEFEDTGFFVFRLRNGALGSFNYTTASFERNFEGSVTVFAERATIKIGGAYLNTIDYQSTDGPGIELPRTSSPPNEYGGYQGSMSNHDKVIHNVIETLNGRDAMMTNALEGLKVVEIIERMYRAAQTSSR